MIFPRYSEIKYRDWKVHLQVIIFNIKFYMMKHFIRFFSLSIAFWCVSLGASAQSSGMIMTTPTQLDYSTTIGLPVEKEVNVKIAGLPSLAVLSSFNAVVQGQDADQFSVEMPSLSLINILEALLGQGINIKVTYNPFSESVQHQAELLIETSLLGVLMPVQETVPIRGEAFEPPVVESTVPANGAQNVAVSRSTIRISYDKNIAVRDASKITINGVPVTNYSVDRGVLTIRTFNFFTSNTTYTVTVEAGAVTSNAGYSTTVQDYSFSFRTEYIAPTYTITPSPGSFIYIDYPADRFNINIQFSAPVVINQTLVTTTTGDYIASLRSNTDRSLVTIECGALTQPGQLNDPYIGLLIPAGALSDAATRTPIDPIDVGTFRVFAGPYVTNVNPVADRDNPIEITTDNFQIPITFTYNRNILFSGNGTPVVLTSDFPGISISSYRIEGSQLIVVVSGTERSFNNFTINTPENTVVSEHEGYRIGNLDASYNFQIIRANNRALTNDRNNVLSEVASESYFTLLGSQVSKEELKYDRIYIKRTIYRDGSVYSQKIMLFP